MTTDWEWWKAKAMRALTLAKEANREARHSLDLAMKYREQAVNWENSFKKERLENNNLRQRLVEVIRELEAYKTQGRN
jgi:hypothetical protein